MEKPEATQKIMFGTLYLWAGAALNLLSLVLNILLTAAPMTGWPSKSAYDSRWQQIGFCVLEESSNNMLPTEVLCFLLLTSSAVASHFLSNSKYPTIATNTHVATRIQTSIFANASHGAGHLFMWLLGGPPPSLEISLEPLALANLVMLMAFWTGVLRTVLCTTNTRAVAMTILVLTIQYKVLEVPPEMAFTYSQSIIQAAGNLDALLKLPEFQNDGFVYFLFSVSLLPLWLFFYLEMTSCSDVNSWISHLGGHTLYDAWLSFLPFLVVSVVQWHDTSSLKVSKSKSS